MAVISKTEQFFGSKKYLLILKCDKNGNFSLTLPPPVSEALGYSEVEGKTKRDCEIAWQREVANFRSASTTEQKVIIYHAGISCHIFRPGKRVDGEDTISLDREDISFSKGINFGLCASVYIKKSTTILDKVRSEWSHQDSSIPDSLNPGRNFQSNGQLYKDFFEIDWTPQAEEFFASMGTAMENMILKLDTLFEDKEKVKQLIESGQKYLPGA